MGVEDGGYGGLFFDGLGDDNWGYGDDYHGERVILCCCGGDEEGENREGGGGESHFEEF